MSTTGEVPLEASPNTSPGQQYIPCPPTEMPEQKHQVNPTPMSPENLSRKPKPPVAKLVKVKSSLFPTTNGTATDLSQSAMKIERLSPVDKSIRQYAPELPSKYQSVSPPINAPSQTIVNTMLPAKSMASTMPSNTVLSTPTSVVSIPRPYVISQTSEAQVDRIQLTHHIHSEKQSQMTAADTETQSEAPNTPAAPIQTPQIPLPPVQTPASSVASVTVAFGGTSDHLTSSSPSRAGSNVAHLTYSFVPGEVTNSSQPYVMTANDMSGIVMISPGEYAEVGPWHPSIGDSRDHHAILDGSRISPSNCGDNCSPPKSVIIREDVILSDRTPIKQEDEQEEQELKHAYSVSNSVSALSCGHTSVVQSTSSAHHPHLMTHSSGNSLSHGTITSGVALPSHSHHHSTVSSVPIHQVLSHSPSNMIGPDGSLKTEDLTPLPPSSVLMGSSSPLLLHEFDQVS